VNVKTGIGPTAHPTLKPPRHLRTATKKWWISVVTEWSLEEHHRRLLTLACESWDRCAQARALIHREGLTVPTTAGGPRLHPAVRVETDARIAFSRLLRELDLDLTPPAESKRPPHLRSIAAGRR
jgi:P27 family predicted phage terminase small subunit